MSMKDMNIVSFFTFSLGLNFFPVFSRVEFIPPALALLAKIFTLVFMTLPKKGNNNLSPH